jgi:hypothetical protein
MLEAGDGGSIELDPCMKTMASSAPRRTNAKIDRNAGLGGDSVAYQSIYETRVIAGQSMVDSINAPCKLLHVASDDSQCRRNGAQSVSRIL